MRWCWRWVCRRARCCCGPGIDGWLCPAHAGGVALAGLLMLGAGLGLWAATHWCMPTQRRMTAAVSAAPQHARGHGLAAEPGR